MLTVGDRIPNFDLQAVVSTDMDKANAEVRESNAMETVMKRRKNLPVFRARRPSAAILVEIFALYAQGK